MKIRGPIVTLGAVAALGIGIWLVNVSKEDLRRPGKPVAEATTTTATTPGTAASAADHAAPAPRGVPGEGRLRRQDPHRQRHHHLGYHHRRGQGRSHTPATAIRSSRGCVAPPRTALVSLANKDKTSRLEGRLEGDRRRRNAMDRRQEVGFQGRARRAARRPVHLREGRCPQQLDHRLRRRRHGRAAPAGRVDRPRAGLVD